MREAHPTDGWRMNSNDRVGISIAQPQQLSERIAAAQKCCSRLHFTMPTVVDGIDDKVGKAYSGMPDRLYILDRTGHVVYKSGRGPFGFKPREMEQSLLMLLLDRELAPHRQASLALPTDAQAWKWLPQAARGQGQPLPSWARALARTLPRTTAAMLRLDYLHRARSPLDPQLRGAMRWVAAHANRCTYTQAYAEADLRQAGMDSMQLRSLRGDQAVFSVSMRLALTFARKMTVAARTVTDAEVAQLRRIYGDKQLVAMVLLLAHANFQDRLLLTLGLPLEPAGPLPARDFGFDTTAPTVPAAEGKSWLPPQPSASVALTDGGSAWSPLSFTDLQRRMDAQRARQPRIPVPSWESVRGSLPPTSAPRKPLRIRWSLVCLGYQPELAKAWSACTRAFAEESRQDRAFEESLFWVVTRSLECFY